ncbi:hypothetical protein L484_000534 [Morus notabilis]|uniref:Uncharacterized protein n=1 Tax=Morus notabilis TaxID=981085 RepID=W9SE08_9ROSA|nr:hypothetical protein L484_000534 [Morus notabilis]
MREKVPDEDDDLLEGSDDVIDERPERPDGDGGEVKGGGGSCGEDGDGCNEGADESDDKCGGVYVRKAHSFGIIVFSFSVAMNFGTGVASEEEISEVPKG